MYHCKIWFVRVQCSDFTDFQDQLQMYRLPWSIINLCWTLNFSLCQLKQLLIELHIINRMTCCQLIPINIKERRISLWWLISKIVAPSYTKPCYKPLTDLLLGATIRSQGHSMMDLLWLQASLHQQWVNRWKYYHPLTDWLLEQQMVTMGCH